MYASSYANWMRAGLDAWALGCEASTVIGLRMAKLTRGGKAADDEICLMLTEKMRSVAELQTRLVSGRLGHSPLAGTQNVLRHYRGKVAANRRRLG